MSDAVKPGTGLLVVIATYNEIDSLPRLIELLHQYLPAARVLVIDDGSPDGTGQWCERQKPCYPFLDVIHRDGKLGLGSATLLGFQRGLTLDVERIATMDADLSHDPAALPEMLARFDAVPVQNQPRVVIGSRYVPGGGVEGWPATRRMASKWVNAWARFWLRLPTQDNSGAFRVYDRAALEQLNHQEIHSSDYAYLEEILWRLNQYGVELVEHPIVFRDREQGTSKTSLILGVKVFWQIFRMGIGWWPR